MRYYQIFYVLRKMRNFLYRISNLNKYSAVGCRSPPNQFKPKNLN